MGAQHPGDQGAADRAATDQAAARAVAWVHASYRAERTGRMTAYERNLRERAARRARGLSQWAERTRR
jgi:hypothetical protein